SDLLQAVAKNIETSASSRTLRIAFSLVARCSVERGKLETGQGYDRRRITSSARYRGLQLAVSQAAHGLTAKKFFDYFVGICIIRSLVGRLGRMLWR
ncbi:MAG: hypothetical protein WA571_01550, partial [Candidatus Binatus sp.]